MIAVRDTAAARTATEAAFRTASGRRPIERVMVRTADGLREVFRRGLRASVAPDNAYGSSFNRTGPISTGPVQVSLDGGSPPYTHSWSTDGGITAASPNSAMTTFRGTPPNGQGHLEGTLTDTITDANGLTVAVSVFVMIDRESFQ